MILYPYVLSFTRQLQQQWPCPLAIAQTGLEAAVVNRAMFPHRENGGYIRAKVRIGGNTRVACPEHWISQTKLVEPPIMQIMQWRLSYRKIWGSVSVGSSHQTASGASKNKSYLPFWHKSFILSWWCESCRVILQQFWMNWVWHFNGSQNILWPSCIFSAVKIPTPRIQWC